MHHLTVKQEEIVDAMVATLNKAADMWLSVRDAAYTDDQRRIDAHVHRLMEWELLLHLEITLQK